MATMPSHNEKILDQFSRQAVPFSTAAPIRDDKALRLLVTSAGTTASDHVLDVACGPGLVVCAFAEVAERVTGIDLTPAMIERAATLARDKGLINVELVVGDVLPLPFPDESFSIVVSRFAFHHFPSPKAVLAEMRRVCRRGGRVVVADLTASESPEKAAAFHRMEILRDPSHARALSASELRSLVQSAGLTEVEESGWGMDIEVEALMARSFPEPGSESVIRAMFADSLDGDRMGLSERREGDRIWFTYSNLILAARR